MLAVKWALKVCRKSSVWHLKQGVKGLWCFSVYVVCVLVGVFCSLALVLTGGAFCSSWLSLTSLETLKTLVTVHAADPRTHASSSWLTRVSSADAFPVPAARVDPWTRARFLDDAAPFGVSWNRPTGHQTRPPIIHSSRCELCCTSNPVKCVPCCWRKLSQMFLGQVAIYAVIRCAASSFHSFINPASRG